MKPLTRKQMRTEHRRLWRWLAKKPKANKDDWPGWKRLGFRAWCCCFACEVTREGAGRANCSLCPIKWSGGEGCHQSISEYQTWRNARLSRRAAAALKIAEMWPKEGK
jgi:hypothetical protein